MTQKWKPGSAGGRWPGLWYSHAAKLRIFPNSKVLQTPLAENTVIDAARQFRGAQARRRPVLTVQIGVRASNQPHGRSRPFSLSADALDRLLDTAARLERRP